MSQFKVTSFNYIISGKKERLINLDIELPEKYCSNIGLAQEQQNLTKNLAIRFDGTLFIPRIITRKYIDDVNYDKSRKMRNVTFVANIQDDDDNMRQFGYSNQFSMYDISNDCVIHPLYDINDICLKSNIKKVTDGHQSSIGSDQFVDIYSPQEAGRPIHVVKMQDFAYAVSEKTEKGPLFLRTNLDEMRKTQYAEQINDTKYNYKLKSDNLHTYLYGSERSDVLSSNFQRHQNLSSVQYNYIYEIPLDAQEYNDFESGDIQAEILQAKNAYDSLYTMNMPDGNTLSNTRQYCGVGQCSGKLYMKYFDNVQYRLNDVDYDYENEISNVGITQSIGKYSYQKLETIDSINRFKSNIKHKSNLYSVSIRNTGLNTNYQDTNIQKKIDKLKNDIKHNIRDIVKQICPVNTQLFDVYFDGV